MTDGDDPSADDTDDGTADEPEPWPGEWESAVELESTTTRTEDE